MERRAFVDGSKLSGYDALTTARGSLPDTEVHRFTPQAAFGAYHRMHKVFVNETGAVQLETIARSLEGESMPEYLDVAAWAWVENGLALPKLSAVERVRRIERGERCWEAALSAHEQWNGEALYEDSEPYRLARNLAFMPLAKALVLGNVTAAIREQVFVDTMALSQASVVQAHLANTAGNKEALGDHLGFQHENNAHLSLLYMDDPRYVCMPSSARGGSGHDYPEQTHDLVVINQHWGEVLKIVPVEVKAAASLSDIKRYEALIVRGKMHLSVTGSYSPEHTLEAFAAAYDGRATSRQEITIDHATSTMKKLLQRYAEGERISKSNSKLQRHAKTEIVKQYPELSLDRSKK